MSVPLQGLRAVDFSRDFAGAIVSLVLADYGAEVVKVETPEGDPTRSEPAFYMWHRGKKSIVLNLNDREEHGQAVALAAGADIALIPLPPSQAKALGLDYESLQPRNPSLIYASLTPLGPRGKYAELPNHEWLVQAKTGSLAPKAAARRPGPAVGPIPWGGYGAAQALLQGILAALYVREQTGKGQRVSSTLAQGLLCQDPNMWLNDFLARTQPEKFGAWSQGGQRPAAVPVSFPALGQRALVEGGLRLLIAVTKDGHWLQFAQYSNHLWAAFMKALELEEVIRSDPAFAHAPLFPSREEAQRFGDLMRMKIYSKTLAEWEEHFKEHPDVGMEVFRTPEEGLKHPQLLHNGQVMEFTDPRVGKTVQLAPVFKMSKTPGKVQGPAPDLGQHTKEVLGRLKGGAWKPSPRQVNGKVPARPLEGVTIVELALYYAAPFGPAALTDLGARVIKLEHPKGDDFRYSPQGPPEVPAVRVLQGKESVAVDLNFPEGQAIAHKIIEGADMLMTSWRGGMAKTLNMDHETLRRLNPNLIYVYGVGYGIDGPYAKRPAYAPTATAAIGGTRYQIGTAFPDVRGRKLTPEDIREIATYLQAGPGNADGVSAMTVGSAMLMGLVARQRLGIAQEVLTSMPCSTGHCCSAEMVQYDGKRPGQQVDPQLYGTDALNRLYETKEGWIVLAAQTQDNWRHFTEVVERLSSGTLVLRTDSRFANSSARQQNDHTLTHLLAGFFKEWSAAELEDAMLAHNVPCVKVETYSPAWYQTCGPAMLENGFVDEVVHPIFGRHPRMGPLVTMSLTPGISKPSPKVGQDTGRVLAECGYSEQDMDALESKGVIRRG